MDPFQSKRVCRVSRSRSHGSVQDPTSLIFRYMYFVYRLFVSSFSSFLLSSTYFLVILSLEIQKLTGFGESRRRVVPLALLTE